jgi:hypothetical protein
LHNSVFSPLLSGSTSGSAASYIITVYYTRVIHHLHLPILEILNPFVIKSFRIRSVKEFSGGASGVYSVGSPTILRLAHRS